MKGHKSNHSTTCEFLALQNVSKEAIEQLYGGVSPSALRKQTNRWQFGKQAITFAKVI